MSLVISYGNRLLGKRYLNNAELRPSKNSKPFARGASEIRLHRASAYDKLQFL